MILASIWHIQFSCSLCHRSPNEQWPGRYSYYSLAFLMLILKIDLTSRPKNSSQIVALIIFHESFTWKFPVYSVCVVLPVLYGVLLKGRARPLTEILWGFSFGWAGEHVMLESSASRSMSDWALHTHIKTVRKIFIWIGAQKKIQQSQYVNTLIGKSDLIQKTETVIF